MLMPVFLLLCNIWKHFLRNKVSSNHQMLLISCWLSCDLYSPLKQTSVGDWIVTASSLTNIGTRLDAQQTCMVCSLQRIDFSCWWFHIDHEDLTAWMLYKQPEDLRKGDMQFFLHWTGMPLVLSINRETSLFRNCYKRKMSLSSLKTQTKIDSYKKLF